KQFRALADRFYNHRATPGMPMHSDPVGGRQILQGLDQDTGIVLNGAFEMFNGNFPGRRLPGGAADGNMVVATGQEDQLDIGSIVGLSEVAMVFQKTMNTNDRMSGVGAVVTNGNGTFANLI